MVVLPWSMLVPTGRPVSSLPYPATEPRTSIHRFMKPCRLRYDSPENWTLRHDSGASPSLAAGNRHGQLLLAYAELAYEERTRPASSRDSHLPSMSLGETKASEAGV